MKSTEPRIEPPSALGRECQQPGGARWIWRVVYWLAVAVAYAALWYPEFTKYATPLPPIAAHDIAALRSSPSDASLQQLVSDEVGAPAQYSGELLVQKANQLLAGELSLPGYAPVRVVLPFDFHDLKQGLPTWQLMFASLAGPRLLLDAYAATGDERYFVRAKDIILAFSEFESRQFLDEGFLWNDHAIAARGSLFAKFWWVYRQHHSFDEKTAALIMRQVIRTELLLAKPNLYTFATNHGVMQNVALLQLAAAFPHLPRRADLLDTALARLSDQIRFLVNDEGFVLEHSAGYHEHGVSLLGLAIQLTLANARPVPKEWAEKYRRSKIVLAELTRPDGSLPMFGDTAGRVFESDSLESGRSRPNAASGQGAAPSRTPAALYPVAGYAVAWDHPNDPSGPNRLTQTVLAWSNFPGHGHKLADEMSLLIWSGGSDWVSNSGYWPYGVWGREQAGGWDGSNAPHALNESAAVERTTVFDAFGEVNGLQVFDLHRTTTDGYLARRQVIHIEDNQWLVLDSATDTRGRPSVRTWTFPRHLDFSKTSERGTYVASAPGAPLSMDVAVGGDSGMRSAIYKGSKQPFAGWVALDHKPATAFALQLQQPADGNVGGIFFGIRPATEPMQRTELRMVEWSGPKNWRLELHRWKGEVTQLERAGLSVRLTGSRRSTTELLLRPRPDSQAERKILTTAFDDSSKKYHRQPERQDYRFKISYAWLAALVAIEFIFFFILRLGREQWIRPMRIAGALAWLAGCIWTTTVYLGGA